MNWYYVENGQKAGPIDEMQLEELRQAGRILPNTLVWREGMPNWTPFKDVQGELKPSFNLKFGSGASGSEPAPGSVPEAVCTECNRIYPTSSMIRYGEAHVCVNCKPRFLQKLAEGARLSRGGGGGGGGGAGGYAGFWIRLVAHFLDGLIIGIAVVAPLFLLLFFVVFAGAAGRPHLTFNPADMFSLAATSDVAGVAANLVGLIVQVGVVCFRALYSGFFVGKWGATPGKMICRLTVVDADGAPISYGRAFGRGFAELLTQMTCLIGYIIAGFDDQKRALHDHICGTRVIHK
jgi:uncharacterized RDD family membrane protein YckC